MKWKPIYKNGVPDPYCKQSDCGRFRILRAYVDDVEIFELSKKGKNPYEVDGFDFIGKFKTSEEAEKASENI